MQDIIDKMVAATAGGKEVLWDDFRDSLSPKEYNMLGRAFKSARMDGLVHRRVEPGKGSEKTKLYLVGGISPRLAKMRAGNDGV